MCGAGNRILLYENSNSNLLGVAKVSVDNYNANPLGAGLAAAAENAINNALSGKYIHFQTILILGYFSNVELLDAWDFFYQLVNPIVITAQEQLIQDLTTASLSAAAIASAAAAALLAEQIAAALGKSSGMSYFPFKSTHNHLGIQHPSKRSRTPGISLRKRSHKDRQVLLPRPAPPRRHQPLAPPAHSASPVPTSNIPSTETRMAKSPSLAMLPI